MIARIASPPECTLLCSALVFIAIRAIQVKDFYHLVNFFLVTGTLNQEDSVECSDNQKEENGQDNIDKCKMEIKMTETQDEKEMFINKEITEVLYIY